MLRKFIVIVSVICLVSILAFSQESEQAAKGEFFAGYQYLRGTTGIPGVGGFNLNGWNASMTGYFTRNLGATADFNGSYGSPSGISLKYHGFLFGPAVRFPNSSRLTPFAHALFGGGHGTITGFGSETKFSWAAGGGVDVGVAPHVAVRVAQFDYMQTRFITLTQNNLRYSAGIVLKF
jgi:opacity protein-like surface antigen